MKFNKIMKKLKGLVIAKRNDLMRCCNISDIEKAKKIIDVVWDLNFIDKKYNESPLTLAVKRNSLEMVKLLIENGANVNFKSKAYKEFPLTLAVKQNSPEIVKLLIENGANVDLKNEQGRTPLICAINKRHIEIMDILLENGADANLEDNNKRTPLIHATKKTVMNDEIIHIVEALIKHNADINKADKNGKTPLMWACLTQFRFLIEIGDVNRFQIMSINKNNLVNLLLQNGANIHMIDNNGKTALMHAIDCFMPTTQNLYTLGNTELMHTIDCSSKEVINSLLKSNGIPKYTNKACMGLNINDLYIAKMELAYIQKSEWYKFEEHKSKEFSELIETLNNTFDVENIKQMLQEKNNEIDQDLSTQIDMLNNLTRRNIIKNLEEIRKELVRVSRNTDLNEKILTVQKLADINQNDAKNKLLRAVDRSKHKLSEIKNFESRIDFCEKKEILDMIDLSKKAGIKVANIKNYTDVTNDIKPKNRGLLRFMK